MKIWVVGRGYPTPANRMWGVFELEQAKLLARNGHEVSYIALTLSFFSRKDPRGIRLFVDDGVKVFASSQLYFPGKAGLYIAKYEDACWKKLFAKAQADVGLPDLIHIHYPTMISSTSVIDGYRKQGVKIFVTEHWSRVLINNLKKHELERLQYYANYATCFACVGEPLQQAVRKLVNVTVPMTIIPNIVSPEFFKTYPRNERDEFTFICVGRFLPVKQFDAIIRQYKRMFLDNTRVRLLIVGSGSEEMHLVKEAEGREYFTGEIGIEEVARYIAKSDALVSFSKYETFAAPVAEALAGGKPVIVSDKSGIASYINSELGIVVPADSEESLGMAMMEIYTTIDRFDGEVIKQFAVEHFNDRSISERLSRMYKQ